jgi:FixJ family two-component response regulator
MPGLDGLRLQAALNESGIERPVIFITGYGDIPMSVQAMKAGAVDFLTKPIDDEVLLAAIAVAAEREGRTYQKRIELGRMRASLARLTARETEVLGHVIAGRLNKQIAGDLGTVEKTIKVHRGRIMQKLGVRTIVDLVRLTERAGVQPARPIERHG